MKQLSLTRFVQDPSHCAVAASASAANFYDKSHIYTTTKILAKNKIHENLSDGLETGEIGFLLNYLGFNKVTIVTANLHLFDWEWANKCKKELIECLNKKKQYLKGIYKKNVHSLCKFLQHDNFDNNIIIDYDFCSYIRNYIDEGSPLIVTFNWTLFFKFAKYNADGPDPYKGECEEHAVVICGYDDKYVRICDSHYQCYKYKLKKYRQGFYNMKWEHLMIVMSQGDLILPDNYKK